MKSDDKIQFRWTLDALLVGGGEPVGRSVAPRRHPRVRRRRGRGGDGHVDLSRSRWFPSEDFGKLHTTHHTCDPFVTITPRFYNIIASSPDRAHDGCDPFVTITPRFHNQCSPNEDAGRQNKRSSVRFRSAFQGCEYLIWETKP